MINEMIKAFIFDYGGVVTQGGVTGLAERLTSTLQISKEKARDAMRLAWRDYMKSKLSEEEFWNIIETQLGQSIPDSNRNVWNTWENMQPSPEIVELISKLKDEGYTVGLLSNTVPDTAADIKSHGGYDMFDFVILSTEVGMAKPELEIYNLALGELRGISPDEVVFIDDQERCLVPAREIGIHTILAKNPQQIVDDCLEMIKNNH
jgi:putative hydrolase of the HAD superfamily